MSSDSSATEALAHNSTPVTSKLCRLGFDKSSLGTKELLTVNDVRELGGEGSTLYVGEHCVIHWIYHISLPKDKVRPAE